MRRSKASRRETSAEESQAEGAALVASRIRIVMSKLRRRMREVRPPGLTEGQLLAISRLAREGPMTVTALARAEGIRPQSMGFTVAILEREALIQRHADPSDGRQTLLSLAPAAHHVIADYRAARDDWLSHAIETKLEPGQLAKLLDGLEVLEQVTE